MEHINWTTGFLFPYINFAIFLFLLIKFAKNPAISAFAKRRENFLKLLDEANKAKKEAEEKNIELKMRLDSLESEVEQIKHRAQQEAMNEARQLVEDAQKLAEHIKLEAQRIAQNELKQAKSDIQNEIVRTVKENVLNKIKTDLSENDQSQIVSRRIQLLTQMPSNGV